MMKLLLSPCNQPGDISTLSCAFNVLLEHQYDLITAYTGPF